MEGIDKVRKYFNSYLNAEITIIQIASETGLTPHYTGILLSKLIKEMRNKQDKLTMPDYSSSKEDINDIIDVENIELKKDFTVGDWENMTYLERKKYY